MSNTILIVDDDPHIREVLQFALSKAGFRTETAADGSEALAKAGAQSVACIVLDIAMPEMDGLEVCRRLRRHSDIPILFLSSRDEEIDRIVGFELGGDDYVSKPFSPRELVARVQAIVKRTRPKSDTAPTAWERGMLRVDAERYTAFWQAAPIPLTATEFILLATLLKRPDKVYTREALMEDAYPDITVSDRTIDSHIRRIRQKFAEYGTGSVIETVHGIGYKLGPCQ